MESRLQQSTMQSMHADLALFVRDVAGVAFTRPDGTHPISTAGVLATLIGGEATSLDVDPSDQRAPQFRRLPQGRTAVAAERRLCAAHAVACAGSSLDRHVGAHPEEERTVVFDRGSAFLSAVAASVSLALDNLRLRSLASDNSERPARECQLCSKLNGPDATICTCGGQVLACGAPHTLRQAFRFERRLGAGGMGVVYRAANLAEAPRGHQDAAAGVAETGRAAAPRGADDGPAAASEPGDHSRRRDVARHAASGGEFLAGGTLADRLRTARR